MCVTSATTELNTYLTISDIIMCFYFQFYAVCSCVQGVAVCVQGVSVCVCASFVIRNAN